MQLPSIIRNAPVQNVVQHADLRPGPNVIQNAKLDGGLGLSPMQSNRQVITYGENATAERMYASRDPVSNFGNEVHVGRGQFSQATRETFEVSVESITNIMEKDDQYEGSKIGEYSAMGPTGFQNYNDRSFESQQQIATKAYEYFANYSQWR